MPLYPLPHCWMLEVVDHLEMRGCFQSSMEEEQQRELEEEEEVAGEVRLHWVWLTSEGPEGQTQRNCFVEESWSQKNEVEAEN